MNDDDRLSRYLHQQAEGITLAPADPEVAMRRGTRRRTRRRTALVGGVAVLGVLATSVALRDSSPDVEIRSAASPTATPSSFEWSTIVPDSGLAYGDHTVVLDDGSVYGLSTAPGPYQPDGKDQFSSTLYRSTDGAEWSPVSLPSGVRTADLDGSGSTLYALGTAPSGGLVLSSSDDGAASWASTPLPDDVAQLVARHPGQITLGPARIASQDDSHLVATIVATTNLDLTTLRPEFQGTKHMWEWTDEGVVVYELPESTDCGKVVIEDAANGETDPVAVAGGCRLDSPNPMEEGEEVARFTYDELGIVGELRDHIGGKAYAYATADGTTFQPVELPAVEGGANRSLVATPLATADGYRLITGAYVGGASSTTVLRSADGFTWETAATLPGSAGSVGLVGDRAAVGLFGERGGQTVRIEQADGTWSVLDLTGAIEAPTSVDGGPWVDQVVFGPLGLAATITTNDEDGSFAQYLVHSRDGLSLEVLRVSDVVDTGGSVGGIVVTPDAVLARVLDPADGDPATEASQTVLVGTPR